MTQLFGGENQSLRPARPLWQAITRGLRGKCPSCGEGSLFCSFVKVQNQCPHCGEELHHHRADDFPAYLVIVIAGHIVVGAFMGVETLVELGLVAHLAIWLPLTILLCLALLRPVKGAVVGLQWALYMHGFGGEGQPLETHPEA
jgi:uncharacterized protein (DUF983 family)